MRLIRHGVPGEEKAGVVLQDGTAIDVSAVVSDVTSETLSAGAVEAIRDWLPDHAESAPRIPAGTRLGPPVADPGKIICIGLNYADHARESGAKVPSEPVIFFKATTALCGPNDNVIIPTGSEKTDWEVELAVIIGRRAKRVSEADAVSCIAGYAVMNDLSERHYQLEREGQWVKGKSCDTFAPVGPWLVTQDEVSQTDGLRLWLKVNGEMRQDGSTATMVYKVPFLVSYISQFMTLMPGDIISTGTPPGVGLGMKPPMYLKAGDVIELGIDRLGVQRQVCLAETAN